MPSPNEITIAQLSRLTGTPDAPVLLDVRIPEDFAADPRLLPTAIRRAHDAVTDLVDGWRVSGIKVAVICQKGLKLSQGAAALLRWEGIAAEFVSEGFEGWRKAGLPLVPADRLPAADASGRTVWVTRHRPKIDRIACPWLIRRFIDREACFLYVAPSEVEAVAERFGATPFDVEGAFWSHRGECCTFDTMVEEFALGHEPLLRLAEIVRAADTDRHDLAPQAAGLLAASLGLSRMFKDDLKQLDAGMLLYDALYRWARDAFEEGHDWPVNANPGVGNAGAGA